MLRDRLKRLLPTVLSPEKRERLRASMSLNSAGFDPWGLNLETAEATIGALAWLYRSWFRVRTYGLDRVPDGRVLVVPNHSGQLPFDGMLVALALLLEHEPPRLVRGMVERWFPSLPFVSTLFTRCGQVVGDPENCKELLRREQAIMVFPEGVRGSGKTWWKRYRLQTFGTGFIRMALETQSPVVPVAVIGAEETYPSVYNAAWLAKLLGMPYAPVTPFFPLLGPLGAVPLPVQVDIRFGEPILFQGDPDAPDPEVQAMVEQVKASISRLIDEGLAARPMLQALGAIPGVER